MSTSDNSGKSWLMEVIVEEGVKIVDSARWQVPRSGEGERRQRVRVRVKRGKNLYPTQLIFSKKNLIK